MRNYKPINLIEEYDEMKDYHGITEYPRITLPTKFLQAFEKTDWKTKFKEYDRNRILWLPATIHMLKRQGGDKYKAPLSYVNISADIVDEIVQTDYAKFKNFHLEENLIQCDGIYYLEAEWKKGKCYGFRFNPELIGGSVESIMVLQPYGFPNRVRKAVEIGRNKSSATPSHDLIERNTHRLRIESWCGLQYLLIYELDKTPQCIQTQTSFLKNLDSRKNLFFVIDGTGRIYSTFTNLFKEARSDLRLNEEPLMGVDISGSHFFHLLMMYPDKNSPKSKKLRDSIIGGTFYEELLDCPEIYWNTTRNEVKLSALGFLHAHPLRMNKQKMDVSDAIQGLYPDFWEWLDYEKLPHDNPTIPHTDFSKRLFKEEADRVIVDSVRSLMSIDNDYPVLSLHDALFTTRSRAKEVFKVMTEVYGDHYGYVPQMTIESPDKIKEPVDFSLLGEWDEISEKAVV